MVRLFAVVLLVRFFEVTSDCGGEAPPVNDLPGTQLAAGFEFACDLKNGAVRCWGATALGQTGPVSLPEAVAELAVGATSACARTVKGRVFCWGDNANQQLGAEQPAFTATPLEVVLPLPIAKLAMHSDYVLALASDGRLLGWGNDSEGTLARGDPNPMTWPVPTPLVRVARDHRFKSVTAGQGHACGIDLADVLWCWGRNTRSELGTTSTEHQERSPVRVLDGVSHVVAGAFGTCAVKSGEVFCWGDTPIDDVTGETLTAPQPVKMPLTGVVRQLDLQWFHACALTTTDELFCWGRGIEGQLGDGRNTASATPLSSAQLVREVATGFFFTCVRRNDGAVACTGENDAGQLGLADQNRRATFTPQ